LLDWRFTLRDGLGTVFVIGSVALTLRRRSPKAPPASALPIQVA
jgi:hypothetical protein